MELKTLTIGKELWSSFTTNINIPLKSKTSGHFKETHSNKISLNFKLKSSPYKISTDNLKTEIMFSNIRSDKSKLNPMKRKINKINSSTNPTIPHSTRKSYSNFLKYLKEDPNRTGQIFPKCFVVLEYQNFFKISRKTFKVHLLKHLTTPNQRVKKDFSLI